MCVICENQSLCKGVHCCIWSNYWHAPSPQRPFIKEFNTPSQKRLWPLGLHCQAALQGFMPVLLDMRWMEVGTFHKDEYVV